MVTVNQQRAFTLVELIIIIVLLGILAVSAYPLLGDRAGVDVATRQGELMSLLRLQQQRAMQDTASSQLYGVELSANQVVAIPGDADANVEAPGAITLSLQTTQGSTITEPVYFDAMGCPFVGVGKPAQLCNLNSGLEIVISGAVERRVCLQSQGYIRAGQCTAP
ncbi:prepilin-type N-terminal cleavage/methylation domain-containing protein [Idiomarina seosinensis]|uniref:prepilin-type N-terminal cleavage/methylation domain-containing protein n=1 Tax=Idiomarina seosinensis TaxID=281739 RepID=UPI00384D3531